MCKLVSGASRDDDIQGFVKCANTYDKFNASLIRNEIPKNAQRKRRKTPNKNAEKRPTELVKSV